jgi:hypothetical protein
LPEASVVDASPLIVLGRAGRLSLLRVVALVCWVPPAVALEVQAERRRGRADEALAFGEWLHEAAVEPPTPEVTRSRLA